MICRLDGDRSTDEPRCPAMDWGWADGWPTGPDGTTNEAGTAIRVLPCGDTGIEFGTAVGSPGGKRN